MYAKFVTRYELDYAPRTIAIEQTHYNPTPLWQINANGYKPVIETPMPEWIEGSYQEYHQEETEEEIVRVQEQKNLE